MNSNSGKDDRITQILNSAASAKSPLIERSALAEFAVFKGEPPAPQNWMPLVTLPLVIGLTGLFVFTYNRLPTVQIRALALICFSTVLVGVWFCEHSRKKRLGQFMEGLERPLEELNRLRTYLDQWLRDLDERTSRYFHCVTHSKVTDYYVLTQINASLLERIQRVTHLLEKPKRGNLKEAFTLLQGSILFHDGIALGTGTAYAVPLGRLSQLVTQVIENLERGVRELEEDIAYHRQATVSAATGQPLRRN